MNCFEIEHFSNIDYVIMRDMYHKALKKNDDLQKYIDDLERTCFYYKCVDKRYRKHTGAV